MGPAWLDDQRRDYEPREIAAAIAFEALFQATSKLRHERPDDPVAFVNARVAAYLRRAPGYWNAMAKIATEPGLFQCFPECVVK